MLVRLAAQPFQVLLMLLERPGQLLTREEISRELWPDGAEQMRDECVRVLRAREVFRCLPEGSREFLDLVSKVEDPTHLLILTEMGMNFEQGSALDFYRHEDLESNGAAHVTALEKVTDEAEMKAALAMERELRCRSLPEHLLWRVTLDAPVTAQRHALVTSPEGPCGEGFVVRHSYFHDNNANGG